MKNAVLRSFETDDVVSSLSLPFLLRQLLIKRLLDRLIPPFELTNTTEP